MKTEKEKKDYESPTILTVSFTIEHGFAMSGGTDTYDRNTDESGWFNNDNAETDGNPQEDSSWF